MNLSELAQTKQKVSMKTKAAKKSTILINILITLEIKNAPLTDDNKSNLYL